IERASAQCNGRHASLGGPRRATGSPDRYSNEPVCYTILFKHIPSKSMLLSKEYVGYLARQVTQKLIAGEFIETKNVPAVSVAVNTAMLEELQLEDRINDEVRLILEQYDDELRRGGRRHQEVVNKRKGGRGRK